MSKERLDSQFDFCRELDKEKFIKRQTYLSDGENKENDAEHAWHMAVMALVLSEYSNEPIDLLKTISMILIHDVVEIDAGDTYAYDEEAKKTQKERESKAADRLFGMLPAEQAERFKMLFLEFEEQKTPEARFAKTMDNI
ncbi:MAG: HD domain-containing protein, partial [Lachnospiraceae bacterium]|nr:HD domain-containing protein [Lachnospiraceae bacterium]